MTTATITLALGLPALFAVGIRSLAYGTGGDAELSHESGHPLGRVVAGLVFLLVVVAVGLGILTIVAAGFGKAVSYEHIYPVLVPKH